MSIFKIKDLAIEISDRINDPKQSGYDRFVGLEHYDSGKVRIIRYGDASKMQSSAKAIKKGDVLIARRNVYLKRAGIVDFDGLTSGDSIVLRAKNEVIRSILPFIFNTDKFWKYANKFSDGSMSKRLSPKILMEYEVDLPDNDEDIKRLACLLWSISDTLDSYEEMLKQCDELVKGQFVEMFGKTKNDSIKIKNVFELQMGKTPTRNNSKYWASKDYKWISISDLNRYDKYTGDTTEYISKEAVEKTGIKVIPKDTVIMSFKLTIGKTAITSEDIFTNEAIMAFIPITEKINANYLKHYLELNDWTNEKKQAVKGATLNKQSIGDANFVNPPIELQNKFSDFVDDLDKSKFAIKEAIESLDKIYTNIININLG